MLDLQTQGIITLVVSIGDNGKITAIEAELFQQQRGAISGGSWDVSLKPHLANHHFEMFYGMLLEARRQFGGAIILGDNCHGRINQFRTEMRKQFGVHTPDYIDIALLLATTPCPRSDPSQPSTVRDYLAQHLPDENPDGEYNLGMAAYTRMVYMHMHGISPYREEKQAAA